jgi:peptide deformylase
MLLKIYQAGQPILRQKAKPVSKKALASSETQQLIDSMIETLRDVPGVGLAAPQVGQSLQICIVEDKEKYHKQVPKDVLDEQGRKAISLKVLVNPKLEIIEMQENMYFEGCLSVEGYAGAVSRANKVRVSALDRSGKPISYETTGWHARILQHEIGHLHGELYIDHMLPKSFMSIKNFTDLWRDALQAKIRKSFK